jgi:hypothetical protein
MGCRQLTIPSSADWFSVIMGCLMLLTDESNWQQFSGGITPAEAVTVIEDMLNAAYEDECASGSDLIPTPYWDDVTDTDDEATSALQPWYGYVADPDLPADELTFVEDAAIWAFTGLLAVSGTPAAAILFHTSAPSFVLAMRGDDVAEVIRVVLDAEDAASVETTGDPDELVELPLYPDPALSTHDILVILRELL